MAGTRRTDEAVLDDPQHERGVPAAGAPQGDLAAACPWQPELVAGVFDLVDAVDPASAAFDEGLERLRSQYDDLVYSELIYLLSHLRFEPEEAKRHWARILRHRSRMRGAEGDPPDVRVALVSYFVEVQRKLKNPKIIEMKLFERTRESAYRDGLTGLYNYRIFREYLEQEVLRSERHGTALSLVMVDLDDFKAYNDVHGHEAGNEVLVAVAGLLGQSLRRMDVVARYGGEEFALILPATPKTDARAVAERAREAIESHGFVRPGAAGGGRITASFGVATLPADAPDAGDLVRHADRAMYVAKAYGKNQVQLYGKSRRSFERVETAIEGAFRVPAPESIAMTTVNVSEAGLLFSTPRAVALGTLIDFELRVPGADRPLRGAGRVVHADSGPSGQYRVAICFSEVANGGRALLTEIVRARGGAQSPGDGAARESAPAVGPEKTNRARRRGS